jgi:hypothetical protein
VPNGHNNLQQAVTPEPASSKKKKCAKWPLLSAEGCHTPLDRQHCPLRTNHGVFSRAEKPSEYINSRLFLMFEKGFMYFSVSFMQNHQLLFAKLIESHF